MSAARLVALWGSAGSQERDQRGLVQCLEELRDGAPAPGDARALAELGAVLARLAAAPGFAELVAGATGSLLAGASAAARADWALPAVTRLAEAVRDADLALLDGARKRVARLYAAARAAERDDAARLVEDVVAGVLVNAADPRVQQAGRAILAAHPRKPQTPTDGGGQERNRRSVKSGAATPGRQLSANDLSQKTTKMDPAVDALTKLMVVKESEENWEKREHALKAIRDLCERGLTAASLHKQVHDVIPLVAENMHSQRTALAVTAVGCLRSIVHSLQIEAHTAEIIFTSLLKLSAQNKRVISKLVDDSGIEILQSIPVTHKMLQFIQTTYADKSMTVRVCTAKAVRIVLEKIGKNVDVAIAERVLAAGLADACKEVRDISRENLQTYASIVPRRLPKFLESLDLTTRKSIKNMKFHSAEADGRQSAASEDAPHLRVSVDSKDKSFDAAELIYSEESEHEDSDAIEFGVAQPTFIEQIVALDPAQDTNKLFEIARRILDQIIDPGMALTGTLVDNLKWVLVDDNPVRATLWQILVYDKAYADDAHLLSYLRKFISGFVFDGRLAAIEGFARANPALFADVTDLLYFFDLRVTDSSTSLGSVALSQGVDEISLDELQLSKESIPKNFDSSRRASMNVENESTTRQGQSVAAPATTLPSTPREKTVVGNLQTPSWKLFKQSTPMNLRPEAPEYEAIAEQYIDNLEAYKNGGDGDGAEGPSESVFRRMVRISRELVGKHRFWDVYFERLLSESLVFVEASLGRGEWKVCENALILVIYLIENQSQYFGGHERAVVQVLLNCRMHNSEEIAGASDKALESAVAKLDAEALLEALRETAIVHLDAAALDEPQQERDSPAVVAGLSTPTPLCSSLYFLGALLYVRYDKDDMLRRITEPDVHGVSLTELFAKALSNKKTDVRKSAADALSSVYRRVGEDVFAVLKGKLTSYQERVVKVYLQTYGQV